jgi:hypothetical protein
MLEIEQHSARSSLHDDHVNDGHGAPDTPTATWNLVAGLPAASELPLSETPRLHNRRSRENQTRAPRTQSIDSAVAVCAIMATQELFFTTRQLRGVDDRWRVDVTVVEYFLDRQGEEIRPRLSCVLRCSSGYQAEEKALPPLSSVKDKDHCVARPRRFSLTTTTTLKQRASSSRAALARLGRSAFPPPIGSRLR